MVFLAYGRFGWYGPPPSATHSSKCDSLLRPSLFTLYARLPFFVITNDYYLLFLRNKKSREIPIKTIKENTLFPSRFVFSLSVTRPENAADALAQLSSIPSSASCPAADEPTKAKQKSSRATR